MRVGQDHRVGHALHDRLHLRDGGVHVAHAVVVVLDLEQARQVTVTEVDQRGALAQVTVRISALQVHQDDGGVRAHVARGADLVLEVQLAPAAIIEDGKAIVAAIAFGFPAQMTIAIDDRVAIPGALGEGSVRNDRGRSGVEGGDDGIVHRPQRCLCGFQESVCAVEGGVGLDLAAFEIDGQYHGARETQSDDLFQQHREDLFRALGGEEPHCGAALHHARLIVADWRHLVR